LAPFVLATSPSRARRGRRPAVSTIEAKTKSESQGTGGESQLRRWR
jgi:hypothetical protein